MYKLFKHITFNRNQKVKCETFQPRKYRNIFYFNKILLIKIIMQYYNKLIYTNIRQKKIGSPVNNRQPEKKQHIQIAYRNCLS